MVRLIWAEAVELFKKGEPLFLPRDIEAVAREVQETYEEENPRAGMIADYLDKLLPKDWEDRDIYSRKAWLEADAKDGTEKRTTVCIWEIWVEALNGNPERLDRYAVKEISDIMARMPEWRRVSNRTLTIKPYGRQKYYQKETKA
jgi:hypothetical protein